MAHGFLLIDKPKDWTSHDVVVYLRKITGEKRIGHAGTLDPFATGLLIVGVGREATKRLEEFKNMKKLYEAEVVLGAVSDTQDSTGVVTQVVSVDKVSAITLEDVTGVLQMFLGKQKQIPPMYSAKKVEGKKLYELARKGVTIERQAADIEVFDIKLIDTSLPEKLTLSVACSPGTYIRTLAHDIGEKLGVGAYCSELRRTKIGDFAVDDATDPRTLKKESWQDRLF